MERKSRKQLEAEFVPHPSCDFVTWYTRYKQILDRDMEKIERIRQHDSTTGPIPIKLGSAYKQEFPLKNYQTQMVAHQMLLPRMIVGDAVGLGKTICAIATSCYFNDTIENAKIIVLTTRSTTYQWASEFEKFSNMRPWVLKDSYKGKTSYDARFLQIEQFLKGQKRNVLIAKYSSLIGKRRKYEEGQQFDDNGDPIPDDKKEQVSQEIQKLCEIVAPHGERVILILDEAHKFKTPGTSTRILVENLQKPCGRVYAMTATGIKNRLDEFYAIAYAIGIRPFGSEFAFKYKFCKMKKKHIGKGRYKWDIVGYQNVREFKLGIRPFFYGRSQAQVKEKLPKLSTVYHPFDLNAKETKLLLHDIPNGDYQLPPSVKKMAGEIVEINERSLDNMMTALSVYQLVANSQYLLEPDDPKVYHSKSLSSKEEELLDLLDGELAGEKVIIFTKYRTWIDRLQWLNDNGHFSQRKFLRITGAENEKKREINRKLFQESEEHDQIYINAAGIEGVNLQQAAHLIALDVPWSWGDMLQLVGRMVRMASPNSACTLHILMGKGTIDEYAIETLRSKKGIFEAILGETFSAGILDDGTQLLDMTSGLDKVDDERDFKDLLKAHAKSVGMKDFTDGSILQATRDGTRTSTVLDGKKKKRRIVDEDDARPLWNTEVYKKIENEVSAVNRGTIEDDD